MTKSFPLKLASSLDAYLENRFQRNFGNGVVNLIAFVALLGVGSGYLVYGWTRSGAFMVVLALLSLLLGLWDLWIYKRNLPPVAKQSAVSASPATNELEASRSELASPPSIAESTTRNLELHSK